MSQQAQRSHPRVALACSGLREKKQQRAWCGGRRHGGVPRESRQACMTGFTSEEQPESAFVVWLRDASLARGRCS